MRTDSRSTAGTGFLIAHNGIFATVGHIQEYDPSCEIRAAVDPANLEHTLGVKWLLERYDLDLAIGQLEHETPGVPLRFAKNDPVNGDAQARGFPSDDAGFYKNGLFTRRTASLIETNARVLGIADNFHCAQPTASNGTPLSGKAFGALLTSPALPVGFSGCPIIGSDGVLGINSMTIDQRTLTNQFNGGAPFALNVSYEAVLAAIKVALPDLYETL